MIALYLFLDIMITAIQCFALLPSIATSICKEKRGKWSKWLPYLILVLMVLLITWGIKSPYFHIPMNVLSTIFVLKVGYKDSLYKIIICSLLYIATAVSIDSALFVVINEAMVDPFVVVGDQQFGNWATYFINAAALLIVSYIICAVLKDFQCEIGFKDFIVVLICYLPTFVLNESNTIAFLGLNPEWIRPFSWIFGSVLGVVFILVFLCLKNQIYLREKGMEDKMKIDQLERQYAYYQDKQRNEEKIRSMYHDMKNHLLLLQKQQGNMQLTESLLSQMSDYESYYHTGNDSLDVIIRDKAQEAQDNGIDFKCAVQFSEGAFIQPLDISTIFGNALDNAIEASMKLPQEERMITVKSGRVQDTLVVVFENNFGTDIMVKSSKSDFFFHGLGIPNIRKAVEKYAGECTIHRDNGKFIMKIILPIP